MSARGGLSHDAVQECWFGGNGFAVVIGVRDATEDGPPIIVEGNDACCGLGDGEGVRGEPAPAPVILYFVKTFSASAQSRYHFTMVGMLSVSEVTRTWCS